MIYNEAFDYLWNQLANGSDAVAAAERLKDYQRKRLRRALLARALKPYFLEAQWNEPMDTVGAIDVGGTLPVNKPLIVLDGAIRTTDRNVTGAGPNNNGFELQMFRSGGNSRVQLQQDFIYDEHLLTPWQCAIRPTVAAGVMGQGAPWPLTWPVPMTLLPNEVIQIRSRMIFAPGIAGRTEDTFVQFRTVMVDNQKADDALIEELKCYIACNPLQRPVFLSMTSDGARTVVLPAAAASGQTNAKTKESSEHLLVTGYAALFARTEVADENGTRSNPKWRLQSSEGHTFSREEIDLQTYAYAGPGSFWQTFPHPFLLPRGSSLAAVFDVVLPDTVLNATEQLNNHLIFRCVTV